MNTKKFLLPGILIVVLVGIIVGAFYFYQKASSQKASPSSVDQEEALAIVARVKLLILLPTDEVPTIATVSDLSKLKGQLFFAKAKVGDKVLMYPKAGKAYLYDPVNNRILEVAPINLDTATIQDSQTPVRTESNATATESTE